MKCVREDGVCDFEDDPRPCRKQCMLSYPTIEDLLRELYPLPVKKDDHDSDDVGRGVARRLCGRGWGESEGERNRDSSPLVNFHS